MRNLFRWFSIFIALFLIFYLFYILYLDKRNEDEFFVILTYNPVLKNKYDYILKAFESVLQEEGILYKLKPYNFLLSSEVSDRFIKRHPAIIFADRVNEQLNPDIVSWSRTYLSKGGSIFLTYDVGIKDYKFTYLKSALFADLLSFNYSTYSTLKKDAYTLGVLQVLDNNLFPVTPGKLAKGYAFKIIKEDKPYVKKNILTTYKYGPLLYPIARCEVSKRDFVQLAKVISEDGKTYPGVIYKRYLNGIIFFVNLPLGYLKANSDDLPLRLSLRTFLFKLVKIPHLVNVPDGKGGLVINWHIDANPDSISIPYMIKKGFLRKAIKYSMDITAGPFRDKKGDNLGFDACGKGKKYVKMILRYGKIGSHGGWGHNWFAKNILDGKFKEKQIYKYIKKNTDCLESITKYKIVEYAAPQGVHPQPTTTKILERLGFIAYYYPGDTGSFPNRTFYNNKMVSNKVVAFPVVNFSKDASFYEIHEDDVPETDVESFLKELVDYVVNERTIRLFYSHPYDIPHYPEALKKFLDYVEKLEKEDNLKIEPMSYFAKFLLRFLNTQYKMFITKDNLRVLLVNSAGLNNITFALPKESYYLDKNLKSNKDLQISEDNLYYYIDIKGNLKEAEYLLPLKK